MSDKYLDLLTLQLNRFHEMLELATHESDEYWFALKHIDRIMAVVCPEQEQLDGLMETIEDEPGNIM